MGTEDQIYRELQLHLDRGPAGFRASESGADILLLKHLLTPEEAKIATMHLQTCQEKRDGDVH